MKSFRKFYIVGQAKKLCEKYDTNISEEDFDNFMLELLMIVDEQANEEMKERECLNGAKRAT